MLKTSELKKSAMLFAFPELLTVVAVPVPALLLTLSSSLRLTDAFLLPPEEPPRPVPGPASEFDCPLEAIWSLRGLLLDGDRGGRGAVLLMLRFEPLSRRIPACAERVCPL
jgi:hypothetical protein